RGTDDDAHLTAPPHRNDDLGPAAPRRRAQRRVSGLPHDLHDLPRRQPRAIVTGTVKARAVIVETLRASVPGRDQAKRHRADKDCSLLFQGTPPLSRWYSTTLQVASVDRPLRNDSGEWGIALAPP